MNKNLSFGYKSQTSSGVVEAQRTLNKSLYSLMIRENDAKIKLKFEQPRVLLLILFLLHFTSKSLYFTYLCIFYLALSQHSFAIFSRIPFLARAMWFILCVCRKNTCGCGDTSEEQILLSSCKKMIFLVLLSKKGFLM